MKFTTSIPPKEYFLKIKKKLTDFGQGRGKSTVRRDFLSDPMRLFRVLKEIILIQLFLIIQ